MNTTTRYILIILCASLLFMPFLGQVHLFDWDEINFAECAREMIVSKDYLRVQIDFQPFWEKPPLFIWMQVLSMKIFGINEYAARFPNAFIGVLTLVSLFYVGKKVINERMATWWVLLYAATWLPHFYFKSGIIDPTFNLLIFLAFFQLYMMKHGERRVLHALLTGLFLGLAVLTKGPVAILVAALSYLVYLVINKGYTGYKINHLLMVAAAACITTGIWFGIELINHGPKLVLDFIAYQVRLFRTEDAGHGGPFIYHFIILLVGCFPASAFLFQYYKSRKKKDVDEDQQDFTRWMAILFWVVLILFSIVKTKIVHYSSLCYFPLTYLAAYQVYRLAEKQTRLKTVVKVVFLLTGSLFALLIASMPVIGINKAQLIPYVEDQFAVGNLQANVSWSYTECLWGILYLISIWAAVWFFRKNFRKTMIVFCIIQLVIIQVTILHFTPKIEAYSQRAAIEYFKSFRGKDVYVQVLDYKSYAHLFYTQKQPSTNPDYYNEQWLLTGSVDKPTFFICKNIEAAKYRAMPQLEQIGQKNGFVFFRRKP